MTTPSDLRRVAETVPNPGSDEAIALGCTCPVLDNAHGKGSGPFWITEGCPLHDTRAGDETSRSLTNEANHD